MDLAIKTYEIKMNEKYADAIRKLVKTLGGTMKGYTMQIVRKI